MLPSEDDGADRHYMGYITENKVPYTKLQEFSKKVVINVMVYTTFRLAFKCFLLMAILIKLWR